MEDQTEVSLGSCEFVHRYAGQIAGELGCWDRLVVTGTLLDVGYSGAMEKRLRQADIRCFDLKYFAEPLREAMRDHAIKLARAAGLEVEFIQRKNFRKEDRITEMIARRGTAPGLVHVFSAMEPCTTFLKRAGARGSNPLRPSACTFTSTSSMNAGACVTCGCPPGCRFGCNFTATATPGWRAN